MLRLFEIGKCIEPAGELNVAGLDIEERAQMLKGAGVGVVLCSGIRRFEALRLTALGVDVEPGWIGRVGDVVKLWQMGAAPPMRFRGRGWGRRRRMRLGKKKGGGPCHLWMELDLMEGDL